VYRSYVNVVQTVGRSCGGPVGGALAQTIGWRWALLGQAPVMIVAMILVAWKVDIKPKSNPGDENTDQSTQDIRAKLKRIDFLGALFMSTAILSAMLILDMGGEKVPWTSPIILLLAGISVLSGLSFYLTEKYYAKEPIFPLRLLSHKEVVLVYSLLAFQIASQVAVSLNSVEVQV
jgi:MFS family permease